MKVSIFEAEKCLRISRAVLGDSVDQLIPADLLCFLPRDIFGHTHEATIEGGNFVVVHNNETWTVPPYFIHLVT